MFCMKWVLLSTAVMAASAQVPDQVRQAAIAGSRGTSGKCTIEVRVDMVAEVDIYGGFGRLRTLGGQPATWTRMECTDPLPYNMSDFRFRGVDGRGAQKLVNDPRNNNGMATIRIEDPRSGSEGYTFDIEWSGASGGAPTGGFPSGSPYYTPSPGGPPSASPPGPDYSGRRSGRNLTAERAIDLCRGEVRTRAERDYNLRNIDITAAAVDTGRDDLVTGAFTDRTGNFRRTGGYRFNCVMDYNSGAVRSVEIRRPDGSILQPGSGTPGNQFDQNRVFRACQDAVVARAGRDGYQNVNFTSTALDVNRSGWVTGTITGTRGPVTDTFDFGCSMDFPTATVRNLQLNRR